MRIAAVFFIISSTLCGSLAQAAVAWWIEPSIGVSTQNTVQTANDTLGDLVVSEQVRRTRFYLGPTLDFRTGITWKWLSLFGEVRTSFDLHTSQSGYADGTPESEFGGGLGLATGLGGSIALFEWPLEVFGAYDPFVGQWAMDPPDAVTYMGAGFRAGLLFRFRMAEGYPETLLRVEYFRAVFSRVRDRRTGAWTQFPAVEPGAGTTGDLTVNGPVGQRLIISLSVPFVLL